MKRYTLFIIFFLFFGLNVYAQDYYTGNTRVKGISAEYCIDQVDYYNFSTIKLDNATNILSAKYPYDLVTGQYYSEALHPQPLAQPDYEMLDKIVDSVFCASDKEKYFSHDCHIFITVRINPHTYHANEIVFSLHYTSDDKRILALPVSKIEQLEAALKKDLIFYVPKRGKNADFLLISGRVI